MIVPAYTFRPMTRSAMVIERLAAENGYSAAQILSHVGHCPYRNNMMRACRSIMFLPWQWSEAGRPEWQTAPPEFYERHWASFSEALLIGIEGRGPCPNCETPCHPIMLNEPMRKVE